MSKGNDGGPAFPHDTWERIPDEGGYERSPNAGMTLRDYFAAKAMQGIIGHAQGLSAISKQEGLDVSVVTATAAYALADAMLAERIK